MRKSTPVADVHGAALSRRQFVKTGGALVVGVGVAASDFLTARPDAQARRNSVDASRVGSWFEIRADNTITVKTYDGGVVVDTTGYTAYTSGGSVQFADKTYEIDNFYVITSIAQIGRAHV